MTVTTTTKPKPAPSGAANNVRKGQSSRMVKGRDAKRRVEANKAAVDKLNGEPTRDELVQSAQQLQIKGASAMRKDDLVAAIAKAKKQPEAKPEAAKPAYRPALAKEQLAALKAWEQGGRKGKRPETPDYDAIQEQYANGGAQAAAKKRKPGTGTRTSKRGERGQKAMAAKAKADGKRGKGKRLTDEQLTAYVANVKATHPDSPMADELAYAYWIEGLALSRAKFAQVWEDTKAKATRKAA